MQGRQGGQGKKDKKRKKRARNVNNFPNDRHILNFLVAQDKMILYPKRKQVIMARASICFLMMLDKVARVEDNIAVYLVTSSIELKRVLTYPTNMTYMQTTNSALTDGRRSAFGGC